MHRERLALLLLVACRNRVLEPDLGSGLARIGQIIGRTLDAEDVAALADAVAAGDLHDPVRLPPGALQCHWHLRLTPQGMAKALALPDNPTESGAAYIKSHQS
jgi:hypothetical protein